jgi:hypothetical protein
VDSVRAPAQRSKPLGVGQRAHLKANSTIENQRTSRRLSRHFARRRSDAQGHKPAKWLGRRDGLCLITSRKRWLQFAPPVVQACLRKIMLPGVRPRADTLGLDCFDVTWPVVFRLLHTRFSILVSMGKASGIQIAPSRLGFMEHLRSIPVSL